MRSKSYQTNHLLIPWGDDFKFQQGFFFVYIKIMLFIASLQFKSMDALISIFYFFYYDILFLDYINENSEKFGVTIEYSTLSNYFNKVYEYAERNNISFPSN